MDTSALAKFRTRGEVWDVGNNVLYQLCRDFPRHTDHKEIIAKIWLIGRAYAAAIERRKNKVHENDNFYEDVVAPIMASSDIDAHLKNLQDESEITDSNTKAILATHKYLTDLFNKMTRFEKRSLASKYLHFHLPDLFYLYDSRAVSSLRRILPKTKVSQHFKHADEEYAKFFLRMNILREKIYRNEGIMLTPRQLDNILLSHEA
jgi:hypothetical protein